MKNRIALLGQPNSGKSTVFNALTGSRQHVGNWPGKTVEKIDGYYTYKGTRFTVTDLPGSYGLSGNSDEEVITTEFIPSQLVRKGMAIDIGHAYAAIESILSDGGHPMADSDRGQT